MKMLNEVIEELISIIYEGKERENAEKSLDNADESLYEEMLKHHIITGLCKSELEDYELICSIVGNRADMPALYEVAKNSLISSMSHQMKECDVEIDALMVSASDLKELILTEGCGLYDSKRVADEISEKLERASNLESLRLSLAESVERVRRRTPNEALRKEEFVEAVKMLKSSFVKINELLNDGYCPKEICDVVSNYLYPFNGDFSEVTHGVMDWADHCTSNIKGGAKYE